MSEQTRDRLIVGVLDTVRELGVSGVSARVVAARAGVNQALIFYHFGTVDALLAEACRSETARRVGLYRERLATVASFSELLQVGKSINEEEREAGNVAVLAHMLAGSSGNAELAAATGEALRMWLAEVEKALDRIISGGPLDGVADPGGLAYTVSAAFVGLELLEGVDAEGSARALDELERLGALAEVIDDLGPVMRRAVRAKLARRR